MMPDVNEDFVSIAKSEGWYSDSLMERIAREGHVNFQEVPEQWRQVFVTANNITADWHMRMQAAFQEFCDSAISKTTNFSHTATVQDVRAIYEMAYEMKCQSPRCHAISRWIFGWIGGSSGCRLRPAHVGLGYQWLDSRAVLVLRHFRPEADVWPIVSARKLPIRLQPRSSRTVRGQRRRPGRLLRRIAGDR